MRCKRRIVNSLIWSLILELSKELILVFADKIIANNGKGSPWVKRHYILCTIIVHAFLCEAGYPASMSNSLALHIVLSKSVQVGGILTFT